MALETLTFDFNATIFPTGLDFIAAFEDSPLDIAGQYSTSESLSVAKKALDEEDEFEDDDEEEEDDEEADDEFEDDDDDEEEEADDEEYEDDDEEDDDEEEDEDDDDVDELQVGPRR